MKNLGDGRRAPTRAGLIAAAYHQLHAPVILIWDNLTTHISTVVPEPADAGCRA